MMTVTISIITITILFAALNRLIGSGYKKNLSRYCVYATASILPFLFNYLVNNDVNHTVEYSLLLFGITYAIGRQFSPTIAWLAAQLRYHTDFGKPPSAPLLTRWLLKTLFRINLNDGSIYTQGNGQRRLDWKYKGFDTWSDKDFRIAGILGGAIRGLYFLPMVLLSFYHHNSFLYLTLQILSCLLFGVYHWIYGKDVFTPPVEGLDTNFRWKAEMTVGALIIAPSIYLAII